MEPITLYTKYTVLAYCMHIVGSKCDHVNHSRVRLLLYSVESLRINFMYLAYSSASPMTRVMNAEVSASVTQVHSR